MNLREWALVTFTILSQMSVGAFLVLGVVHFYALRKAGEEEADRLSDRALLAIGPVMVLGLVASLFHLGNPLNSYRAVTNLGTSWLSREILFVVLFTILGAVFAFMQWRKIATFAVRNVIAWIAALVGLALVYSMSQVYMLPTQPSWNTLATPVNFFKSTLLLGSLAMGVAFVANYAYVKRQDPDCEAAQCELLRAAFRGISVFAVILLGVELVVLPIYLAVLASGSSLAAAAASQMITEYGLIFALRLILVFVGAGLFGLYLYQLASTPGRESTLANIAYGAFALVLVAEVLARFMFYATQVQIVI